MWALALQRIILEFFWDFIYFPIWWYSRGAKKTLIFCYHIFLDGNNVLAPVLWIENLFVPMYGQRDLQGRIMSFFMRLVNFFIRSFALLIWIVLVLLLFSIYLVFPFFVIYMIIFTIT